MNTTLYSLLYGREAKSEFTDIVEDIPDFVQHQIDLRNEAKDAINLA